MNKPSGSPDIESPRGSDGDPSDMSSGVLSGRDDRPDPIPGGETEMPLRPGPESSREPEGVEPCPLVGSPACGHNPENRTVRVQDMIDLPDARRVEGVGLGEAEPGPVELGPAPRAGLDRKSGRLETFEQSPPGGVDGRRIFQRGLGPGADPFQNIRPFCQKPLDRTISLLPVAGPAGESQVGDSVRSAKAPGMDVVDLQRNILRLAVSAGPAPLVQEVFPDFVSGQCSLLVFDTGNFRVFRLLEVELHEFLADPRDGNELPEAFDPGHRGLHPVAERRGQPAFGPSSVVEPGLAVAEPRPFSFPEGPSLVQLLSDLRSPVGNLGRMEDVDGLFPVLLLLPDHDDAGGLRSGVDLDPDGLGVAPDPVFQPDRERGETVDHGPAFSQKLPGPGRVAGHERVLFLVQHKNLHFLLPVLTCFWPCDRDAPLAGRLPSGMVSDSVLSRPVSPLPSRLSATGTSRARN